VAGPEEPSELFKLQHGGRSKGIQQKNYNYDLTDTRGENIFNPRGGAAGYMPADVSSIILLLPRYQKALRSCEGPALLSAI
jgi:hypothetical protein